GVALLPRKSDPAKIVFDCQKCGFTHQEMSEILRKQGIEPEYAGGGKIVLMFSPCNDPSDFERLLQATQNLPRRDSIPYPDCTFFPKRILSVREATFAPSEQISVEESVGRIAAESKVICPPAIPIVTAGERIGKTEKNLLQNSGIFLVKVVK
ncbi:MAG: amino acid decarboxylase, partial [Oscillospiraceae bacterium]